MELDEDEVVVGADVGCCSSCDCDVGMGNGAVFMTDTAAPEEMKSPT